MSQKPAHKTRLRVALNLCAHFDKSILASCARAGLEVLETDHKEVVLGGRGIACGVALDRCRQHQEPEEYRWDYLFTIRDQDIKNGKAIAIEVHHADAGEVKTMIAKQKWAIALLEQHCPNIRVHAWVWLASPPEGKIFFTHTHPEARRLAEAGIAFPRRTVQLP